MVNRIGAKMEDDQMTLPVVDEPRPAMPEAPPAAAPADPGGAALELAADLTRGMDAPTVTAGAESTAPPQLPPPTTPAKRGPGRPKKTEVRPPTKSTIVKPVRGADGKFGAPPATGTPSPAPSSGPAAAAPGAAIPVEVKPTLSPEQKELAIKSTAAALVKAIEILGSSIGGPDEWRMADGERSELAAAAVEMCRYHDWSPASPSTVFVLAVWGYASPRFEKPRTRAKVVSWLTLGGGWLRRMFGR
jgi:hypothetical protein